MTGIAGLKPTVNGAFANGVGANNRMTLFYGQSGTWANTVNNRGWGIWVTKIGAWLRSSGTVAFTGAIYRYPTPGAPPTDLMGKTIATSGSSSVGSQFQANVATPFLILPNETIAYGFTASGNVDLAYHTNPAGNTWIKTAQSVPAGATNPLGTTAGWLATDFGMLPAVWFEYEDNIAPSVPTSVGVEGNTGTGITVNTTTPLFSFIHVDADQAAGRPDKIQRYRIRVIDHATGASMWPLANQEATAEFTATPTEQVVSNVITRTYPGGTPGASVLIPGSSYRYSIQTQDLSGAWGSWSSDKLFTVALIGSVDVTTSVPTGKVDGPPSAIAWTGKWSHPSGTGATNVQVRVLQNGAQWKLGAEVAKSVASSAVPGTAFTISAAEAGIGDLPRGQAWTFQIRGKAGGIWSGWSSESPFTTNAPPNTPVPIAPSDTANVTGPPTLAWTSSDPDPDDVEGVDVVWTVRLNRPSPLSQLLLTHPARSMSYEDTLSQATLALTNTDCPSVGTYTWDVMADDLSASAASAGYGQSPFSTPRSFVMALGPFPTLNLPTSVATSTTPLYSFSVANGPSVAFQITVYNAGTNIKAWDSGRIDTAATSLQQPEGYLKNARQYEAVVTVWAAGGGFGVGNRKLFTVTYTPPGITQGVQAVPYVNVRDPEPTSIQVSWQPSLVPSNQFSSYVVRRRFSGEPDSKAVTLRIITNQSQTRWWDHNAPANRDLIYSVAQRTRSGALVIESADTEVDARVDLSVIVLASATQPSIRRTVLRWQPARVVGTYNQNAAEFVTWGSEQKPTTISSSGTQRVLALQGTLLTDDMATREEHFQSLEEMYLAQELICYRDFRQRVFGRINTFNYNMDEQWDEISMVIGESNYREGQSG